MNSELSHTQNQKILRSRVEITFRQLVKLKKENNKESFNEELLKILPEVKNYINGRITSAMKKGNLPKGKYKAGDFYNQLFIEVYDHIEELKDDKDFYLWIFKKTNELLEDVIVEEEFNDFFFKNIDDYSKPEWDAMEEEFSTDGDGDLMMIEELDDISYKKNDYTLNHVFIEGGKNEFVEKIDRNLNQESIDKHIQMVLHNLTLPMQTVFELSTQQMLSLHEIAQVRSCTEKEVANLLNDARETLQKSLLNRYSLS
ncbi:sigma-70 family RNA polymerase sigma factor [Brumimicrobium glaciale]|uniref:Sigma-70 family RNA polymerase sigma factor n=1 Tax=Brumimicrobium glaciale TaxID=200475 RepID=A0A4Q4KL78_9FLAO|nr:sigma-70 family RNA polymerase sigma factor [Brumimicrobium glaciale]RYM34022.1 sigma-70 family RNA polymerase sigma factor [Brumimicrobium glaciale]